MQFDTRICDLGPFVSFRPRTGAARSFHLADEKLSRYDPLDPAHNHSKFQLKWRKTPRMVKEEEDRCLQVRRDGRSFYEEGINIQVGSYIYWDKF